MSRWRLLNLELGLQPLRRQTHLARYARQAVENAQSIESTYSSSYGGHRHNGPGNPLLTELPLPDGWQEPPHATPHPQSRRTAPMRHPRQEGAT